MNTRALVVLTVIMASTLACAPGRPRARGTPTQGGKGGSPAGGNKPKVDECELPKDFTADCDPAKKCTKPTAITTTKVTCPDNLYTSVFITKDAAATNSEPGNGLVCKNGKWMATEAMKLIEIDAAAPTPYQVACTEF